MTTGNTVRVVHATTANFDPDEWWDESVEALKETAAKRNKTIRPEEVRYIGRVPAPEKYADVPNVGFYAFEAEAAGPDPLSPEYLDTHTDRRCTIPINE